MSGEPSRSLTRQRTRHQASAPPVADYLELRNRVVEAGLLERRRGYYAGLATVLGLATLLLLGGVVLLGDSWWQLVLAAALGIVVTQWGFLAHEAAHREIAASTSTNDRIGRLVGALVVGTSFAAWKSGHNRHHAHPNDLARDPSVARGAVAHTPEQIATAGPLYRWYAQRQAFLLPPLLLLAGLNLQVEGLRAVLGRAPVAYRQTELILLAIRHAGALTLLLMVMPVGKAVAFAVLQTMVFGVVTASAFIPNHVGMPMLSKDAGVDFLRRQVLTSRNLTGGRILTAWMGGLNHQVEHHLFPTMPRPALAGARVLVRDYCRRHGIPYTEVGPRSAGADVLRHLHQVGLLATARASANCPTAVTLGR